MITIEKKLNHTLTYPLETIYPLEDILFFDIETTGFLPEVSTLYLIGCAYYQEGAFHLIQWYADNYRSELEILQTFYEFSKNYHILLHFNGDRFDIPYVTKKFAAHHLDFTLDHLTSIDLYKKIKPFKKVLNLENYKQKTIEQFLQIPREDLYSGGELIKVYGDYMKAKIYHSKDEDRLKHLLLLHNEEDVIGMLQLTNILFYTDILEGTVSCTHVDCYEDCLAIYYATPSVLPTPLHVEEEWLVLDISKEEVRLIVPIATGELKHYFPNYHDYFYLPEEDEAVHKSIAIYVDKEHRQKATATNCYIKKSSVFLPQFNCFQTPEFRESNNSSPLFFEFTKELLEDSEFLKRYGTYLLLTLSTQF